MVTVRYLAPWSSHQVGCLIARTVKPAAGSTLRTSPNLSRVPTAPPSTDQSPIREIAAALLGSDPTEAISDWPYEL